ncbi:MAG: ABC transporter permease [Alloprevotella tannerae]|nr:ABC transporter permease [Alloprevotella tannerae]
MNKIAIIIRREFLTRIKKKSFIILTILMPFIMCAVVIVPLLLAQINSDEESKVVIVDKTGHYADCFKDTLSFHFQTSPQILPAYKSDTSDISAVVLITDDLAKNPSAVQMYSHKEVAENLYQYVSSCLNDQVRKDKLMATGIPELGKMIDNIQAETSIRTIKWSEGGEEKDSHRGVAMVAGFIMTMISYFFVLTYGGMIMQAVMEEKANRIVELIVSSVKPFQLMLGKIAGILLVGLFQLLIWALILAIIVPTADKLFGVNIAMMSASGSTAAVPDAGLSDAMIMWLSVMNLPYLEMGIMFLLLFIGGYLLYASVFAAIGASINEQQDSSQFMMPIMLLMAFSLYAAIYSVENTDGPLAFWASIFPLSSPIVMMVRIPFGVPLWQEILSVALLYLTALLGIWGSGRIYRVGILMYGKKPSLKQMMRWMLKG